MEMHPFKSPYLPEARLSLLTFNVQLEPHVLRSSYRNATQHCFHPKILTAKICESLQLGIKRRFGFTPREVVDMSLAQPCRAVS